MGRCLLPRRALGLAIVAALAFLLVALLVSLGVMAGLDSFAFEAARSWRDGTLGALVYAATFLGTAPGLIGASAVATLLMATHPPRRFLLLPALALLIAWAANQGAKCLFLRTRPAPESPAAIHTPCDVYSFPSGHAMDSMAVYGVLLCWVMELPAGRWRTVAAILFGLAPLAIGLSRVVIGVHWLSDVVGGWLGGLVVLGLLVLLWRWGEGRAPH